MPTQVTVAAHLSLDELAHRYRKAVDPVERSHFHIIWRLSQGKRVSEVALVTDYCPNWIRILARRYNQHGPQVLADQRKQNTGALPLLSNEAIANRRFETLDELQEVQAQRCVALQNNPTCIRHATLFHWWPTSFS